MPLSERNKQWIKVLVLVAVFASLFLWLSHRAIEEQKAIDQIDREAEQYFE